MPLPLFQLPYVVLKEVLSLSEPCEIFILSTRSQKCFRTIKFIKRPSQMWKIEFNRQLHRIGIHVKDGTGNYKSRFPFDIVAAPLIKSSLMNVGSLKMSLGSKKSCNPRRCHQITAMTGITVRFTEIFHCPIYSLVIGENANVPEDSKRIVDWFNTRQKSVEELHYYTRAANTEDVSYVFSNLKVDNLVHASLKFPDQLSHPEIKLAPISSKSAEIARASWMTLEHILAFDCESAIFYTTNLSSQDLNALLRHWTNGGFSRLERLGVVTNDVINNEIVLEGVDFEKVPQNVGRQYYAGKRFHQISGGFDVTRKSDRSRVTLIDYDAGSKKFELVATSKMQSIQ